MITLLLTALALAAGLVIGLLYKQIEAQDREEDERWRLW